MTKEFPILPTPKLKRAAEGCPLLEGDRGEAWIACCSRRFFPLAKRIAGDDGLAQEVLQTSWIKILEKVNEAHFDGPKACPWVHRIVTNAATNVRRDRLRHGEVSFREEEDLSGDTSRGPTEQGKVPRLSEVEKPGPSPEILAREKEMLVLLGETITLLPATYRQVMELHLYQDLSNQEIAERLHISHSNVTTRLNRAVHRLKRLIDARIQPLPPGGSKVTGPV